MAGYTTSDLRLVLSILQGLAGSSYLQEGELYGESSKINDRKL
jgi:hypothetical protein